LYLKNAVAQTAFSVLKKQFFDTLWDCWECVWISFSCERRCTKVPQREKNEKRKASKFLWFYVFFVY